MQAQNITLDGVSGRRRYGFHDLFSYGLHDDWVRGYILRGAGDDGHGVESSLVDWENFWSSEVSSIGAAKWQRIAVGDCDTDTSSHEWFFDTIR